MSKKYFENIQRQANVSIAVAATELATSFPNAEVVSLVRKGNMFLAKLASDNPFEEEEDAGVPDVSVDAPEADLEEDPFASDEESEGGLEEKVEKLQGMLEKVMDALGVSDDEDAEGEVPEGEGPVDLAPEDPLPEPAKDEPAGVFASKVAGRRHFTATCRANPDASDFQIVKDASVNFPDHEVLKISRDGENVKLLMRHSK